MALINWIDRDGPGRLGVMARPGRHDGLEDDLRRVKEEGVDELVSLLTPEDDGQYDLHHEREIAERVGLQYKQFRVDDKGVPAESSGTVEFLDAQLKELERGKSVVLHCNSGRGRTSLMAASLLVMEGMSPDDAMKHVRGHRLTTVPDTDEQMDWVRQLAVNRGQEVEEEDLGPNKGLLILGAVALIGFGAYLIWKGNKESSSPWKSALAAVGIKA